MKLHEAIELIKLSSHRISLYNTKEQSLFIFYDELKTAYNNRFLYSMKEFFCIHKNSRGKAVLYSTFLECLNPTTLDEDCWSIVLYSPTGYEFWYVIKGREFNITCVESLGKIISNYTKESVFEVLKFALFLDDDFETSMHSKNLMAEDWTVAE